MKKLVYSFIFFSLAIIVASFTIFVCNYVLTHMPSDYRIGFIGYGGTFNRFKTGVDKWAIQPYWIMHIIGIIGMCILCFLRRKEICIKIWQAIMTGILLAIGGFIGAKLLYIIENYQSVKKNGIGLAGVSFFGTVFFMPIFIPVIKRTLFIKAKDSEYMDFCTPAGILMLACIRIGCFMNGCCRGIGIWVKDKPFVYPVQLIECSLDLLLIGFIMMNWTGKRFRGLLYSLFMIGYGLIRFFIEFYRNTSKTDNLFITGINRRINTDQVRHVLSNGQIFSIASVTIGVISGIIIYFTNKKKIHHIST